MKEFYIDLLEDFRERALMDEEDQVRFFAEDKKVTAPQWMKYNVKRGMKIRDEQPKSNKCCTDVGLRRANQIENGETLSLSTLKRMKSFVARHSGQADWDDIESKRAQSLLLWGSGYSKKDADKFLSWVDKKIAYLEKND